MKKINYLALFGISVFVLSSCGGLNKMQEKAADVKYKVTPEVLEAHGDVVAVNVDATYPEKYFNKKAVLTATPVLKYEGGETPFVAKTVQGESVTANNQVISYSGGKVSYSSNVPFTENMMKSELVIRVNAEMKGKTLTFPDLKIADGVIATSNFVIIDPKPVMIKDAFQRVIPESMVADILYVINRADLRTNELKQDDVLKLQKLLAKTDSNSRMEFKNLELSAYASPDGPLPLNDKLAQQRQTSAGNFIKKELKKSKVENVNQPEFLSTKYTAEDWDGFKQLLEKSDIQDKELILRVLSMYSDPVVREKEIKNISKAYKEIADEILPDLRRSKFVLNIDNVGYSDDELKSIYKSDADSLKLEEILYTASLYSDMETQLEVYQKAFNNYPEDYRAANNIGYIYILMGDEEKAKPVLEKAKALKNVDAVNNNLGCVALMAGEVDQAKELFTASMGAGAAVVNYNLGIISVLKGDYDAAANSFGNTNEFNTALVKYLKKDNDGALATLNNVEKDFAKKDYLKAVIAAKQDKTEVVFESLRLAFAKNSNLKNRAKVDMEFAKYFENDVFKSLVQ